MVKVPFSELARGEITRPVLDTGWSAETGLRFSRKPEAEITVNLLDEKTAVVEGKLSAVVSSECGRCGTSVEETTVSAFTYICILGQDTALHIKDKECSEEDSQTVFLDEPIIDISKLLEEQLILSVPEKLLCSENCKGLCYRCGALLNTENCQCGDNNIDSPFAILKKLKK